MGLVDGGERAELVKELSHLHTLQLTLQRWALGVRHLTPKGKKTLELFWIIFWSAFVWVQFLVLPTFVACEQDIY